jgi:hypothetical protein
VPRAPTAFQPLGTEPLPPPTASESEQVDAPATDSAVDATNGAVHGGCSAIEGLIPLAGLLGFALARRRRR